MPYCGRVMSYCDRVMPYCDRVMPYCDRVMPYYDRAMPYYSCDLFQVTLLMSSVSQDHTDLFIVNCASNYFLLS